MSFIKNNQMIVFHIFTNKITFEFTQYQMNTRNGEVEIIKVLYFDP